VIFLRRRRLARPLNHFVKFLRQFGAKLMERCAMNSPVKHRLCNLFLGTLALASVPYAAAAQSMPHQCAPREAILATLGTKYGEDRRAVGIAGQSNMMELFSNSETGTWTLVATSPDGQSCLIASGSHFEVVHEAAPAKGQPA
jgi:hypothetical protein